MIDYPEKVTFLDRLAVGLGCALVTLVSLLFIWCGIYALILFDGETQFQSLVKPILIISGAAGILGFINKDGIVVRLLEPVWKLILNLFRIV